MFIRDEDYTKAFRQGEVLIFKLRKNATIGRYEKPVPVPNNVIREGEKSGHEHKVEGQAQLSLFPGNDEGIIKVGKEGATVTHPEHDPIKLPEGTYAVKTQKEATGQNRHQSVKD